MELFNVWIREKINDDSEIGDLARAIHQDPEFYLSVRANGIVKYLNEKGASHQSVITFEKAWSRLVNKDELYRNIKIKTFELVNKDWTIKLTYEDDPENFTEEKRVVGFGLVEDWGNDITIQPFYSSDDFEGLITPLNDADNLYEWEVY